MTNRQKIYYHFKIIIDTCFSGAMLIILIPIWIIISIAIKIEDPKGTIIFKQTRIGKDGIAFEMFKFRTMIMNAEDLRDSLIKENEISSITFKMKNDPRVTKVGKFLRKTSLDEFPQFINILRGEMSLIGPRPPLVCEVEQYSDFENQRLKVKPGCTGLWQVNGRSNLDFNQMINLDIEYTQRYGLFLDLIIFFKTFQVLLTKEGAY